MKYKILVWLNNFYLNQLRRKKVPFQFIKINMDETSYTEFDADSILGRPMAIQILVNGVEKETIACIRLGRFLKVTIENEIKQR
jgi:hypothetical protein